MTTLAVVGACVLALVLANGWQAISVKIGSAANQFHALMRTQGTCMENQLKTMAGWVAQADR